MRTQYLYMWSIYLCKFAKMRGFKAERYPEIVLKPPILAEKNKSIQTRWSFIKILNSKEGINNPVGSSCALVCWFKLLKFHLCTCDGSVSAWAAALRRMSLSSNSDQLKVGPHGPAELQASYSRCVHRLYTLLTSDVKFRALSLCFNSGIGSRRITFISHGR